MNLFINYWRPIADAPRDGTPILTNVGIVRRDESCWCPCDENGILWDDSIVASPSVWMPVPKFPKEPPDVDEGARATKLAEAAPGLHRSLKRIVDLDNDAHPGLSTWRSCRIAADQQARDILEQLKN